MINQEKIQVKNGNTWNKICPFPVGYVYLSSTNTSPASIYGGTWTQVGDGRYLRNANDFYQGGSNYISVNQMPSHTHTLHRTITSVWDPGGYHVCVTGKSGSQGTDVDWTTNSTGGGQAYYPLYQDVYMWYRTA